MLGRWTPRRDRVIGPAGGGTTATTGVGAEPGCEEASDRPGEEASDTPDCEEAGDTPGKEAVAEAGNPSERAGVVASEAGEADQAR